LLSIYGKLSSNNFWHVRIGVDNRVSDNRIQGEKYVLQNFNEQEKNVLSGVLEKVTSELSEKLFGE
jgi:peptidyl-tRNA hydrolase